MSSSLRIAGIRRTLPAIVLLAAAGWTWPAGTSQAAIRPSDGGGTIGLGQQQAGLPRPPGREWASLAYDPRLRELVLFGGDTAGSALPAVFRGTWTYRSGRWTKRHPARSPSARSGAAMVYDQASGQVLLFGGSNSANPFDGAQHLNAQTWIWTGATWRELHPALAPRARRNADMVYDAARHEVILFGGYDGSGLGDTWAWTGVTWSQLDPASSPSPRYDASMAYDGTTKKVILFGGYFDSAPYIANDTWSWDGTTWTLLQPRAHPRDNAAGWEAAADPASKQILLLGRDLGILTPKNEIWEWTGSNWHQVWPRTVPRNLSAGSMTYDGALRKTVLFGGYASLDRQPGHPYPRSLWLWNGTAWRVR